MASPQLENGHTRIANELLTNIISFDFSLRQLKIVLTIIRFTYGFQRHHSQLSLRFLSKATGISIGNVSAVINQLQLMGVIWVYYDDKDKKNRLIKLNKNYENWQSNSSRFGNSSRIRNSSRFGNCIVPDLGTMIVPDLGTKKESTKENFKESTEAKENDFINSLLSVFKIEYELNRGFDYEITNIGKDRSAIGKLLRIYKTRNKASPKTSEETIEDFRLFFKECLMIKDNWLRINMTPALIVNKLNEIKTIMKGQNNGNATIKDIINAAIGN